MGDLGFHRPPFSSHSCAFRRVQGATWWSPRASPQRLDQSRPILSTQLNAVRTFKFRPMGKLRLTGGQELCGPLGEAGLLTPVQCPISLWLCSGPLAGWPG